MLNAGVKGMPRDASADVPDIPSATDQTEMEAESSTTTFVTPATMKYHPGVAKAWAHVTVSAGAPTLAAGHNFSSTVTDNGTGDFTLTFTTAMSSAFYAVVMTVEQSAAYRIWRVVSQSTTAIRVIIADTGGTPTDPPAFSVVVFGDFA